MKKSSIFILVIIWVYPYNTICSQVFGKKEKIENLNNQNDSLLSVANEFENQLKNSVLEVQDLKKELEQEKMLIKESESKNKDLTKNLNQMNLKNEKLLKQQDSLRRVIDQDKNKFVISEKAKTFIDKEQGYEIEDKIPYIKIADFPELEKNVNEEICLYINLSLFYPQHFEQQCLMGFYSTIQNLRKSQLDELKKFNQSLPQLGEAELLIVPTNNSMKQELELRIKDENHNIYIYSINIDFASDDNKFSVFTKNFLQPHPDKGNC